MGDTVTFRVGRVQQFAAGVGGAIVVLLLAACASPPSDTNMRADGSAPGCRIDSGNLLAATNFERAPNGRRIWRSIQHSSSPSFVAEVANGVVTIEQRGVEPWYLFRQEVKREDLAGLTLRFSAETRGDTQSEPKLHGFDHIAGLHYAFKGPSRNYPAYQAGHTPNVGTWEWQQMSVDFKVPETARSVLVGFIHQAGGTLQARNPSLVMLDCGE